MKQTKNQAAQPFSEDIVDYIAQLKLLYQVPFSYLITEETVLPPESLRFFYLDGNWVNALTEGALSVGEVSSDDGKSDQLKLLHSAEMAGKRLRKIRLQRMHENHRRDLQENDWNAKSQFQTGFLLRSVLVRRKKGLEITGKCGEEELKILRLESLSDEIMLGIFDGELTNVVISEPKTGLRFGSPDNTRTVQVRSVADDDTFGEYLEDTVDLNPFTMPNGRVDVSGLAGKFGSILGQEMDSAQLAYELIAVAHRAEFIKK